MLYTDDNNNNNAKIYTSIKPEKNNTARKLFEMLFIYNNLKYIYIWL